MNMRKRQYIAAAACLAVGMIGFASVYATEMVQKHRQEQQRLAQEQQKDAGKDTELEPASGIVPPKDTKPQVTKPQTENAPKDVDKDKGKKEDTVIQPAKHEEKELEETPETPVVQETVNVADSLHFNPEESLVWPLEGNVLMNYSMDSTVYFATLDQYKYNPAVIIGGAVNSKVYLVAKGRITDISTNEETGCTVTQDLGDGYSAVYGQLKEVNFAVGDLVEAGQVIGFVGEPTKYYATEGSNLYFMLMKDGKPVNPLDYFE